MKNLKFKDLIAKWKGLPAKTKNLVLVMLGIAIFIGAYMLGYQKLSEATTEIQTQVDEMTIRVDELKGYYDNITTYENGIATAKDAINANLKTLPFGIKSEDYLMYVKTMCEDIDCDLQNINFSGDIDIGEFSCQIDNKNVNATAMSSSVSYATELTYTQFKDMLQYIYDDTTEVTFVDSVTLSYDSAEMLLSSTFNITKYYITYDGCEYTPVAVPDVTLGTSDPFGTAK